MPDLGELPPVEDSPPPTGETDDEEDEDDEDEEEDEEEDDDDDDDSDHDGGRRRRGRRGRPFSSRQDFDDDAHKARGRPPSVLTPTEARISSILRGLRKSKDEDGSLLILPFEKLPDKAALPDYYQTILNPIAMDHIKKKAKRKKYQHVDHAMADIERMFENAKLYNEDDSPLFKAAVELQLQARVLALQEKARPDDDFRDEDGKLPLSEIVYNGEQWRVGEFGNPSQIECMITDISLQVTGSISETPTISASLSLRRSIELGRIARASDGSMHAGTIDQNKPCTEWTSSSSSMKWSKPDNIEITGSRMSSTDALSCSSPALAAVVHGDSLLIRRYMCVSRGTTRSDFPSTRSKPGRAACQMKSERKITRWICLTRHIECANCRAQSNTYCGKTRRKLMTCRSQRGEAPTHHRSSGPSIADHENPM